MTAVEGVRRCRRPGARHLQRLPDPARVGPAARRDAAQPRPQVHLRARHAPRRARPTRRSPAPAGRARCLRIPINHGEGNYFAPDDVLDALERRAAASIFRYVDAAGASRPTRRTRTARRDNIAGICNERRNVVGMMPHPERACEPHARQRRRPRAVRVGRPCAECGGRRRDRVAMTFDYRRSSNAHGLTGDEYERIVARARTRAVDHRARHLLGDVDRALLLQELAPPSEEAADARPARAAGAGRERRRRRHRRRPGRRSSRSSRTTTRRSSSPIRARRPASAASSATSSRWARGRSRC